MDDISVIVVKRAGEREREREREKERENREDRTEFGNAISLLLSEMFPSS